MAQEAKIEDYLIDEVKKRSGIIRKVKWIGHNGAPDRLVWIPTWPRAVFVELKAPRKDAEWHQSLEHDRLRKMGFQVFVVDSKKKVDSLLNA